MTDADPRPATDRDLLRAFADRADQAAFAALVGRYGPFVRGVCRRVLGDGPDADDAFQAAFLVLARAASRGRRVDHLGGWLHAVAARAAGRLRAARGRRRGRERPLADAPAREPADDWADVRPILDAEVAALPEKLRSALVLCELRGVGRAAAAAELGVPEGTVSSRVARAKAALRRRLTRRGVALTAVGVAAALADAAPAAVPPGLAAAAAAGAGGAPTGGVVMSLVNLEASAMFWAKALRVGVAAAVVVAAGVGAGVVGYRPAAAQDKRTDADRLRGDWVVTSAKKRGQDPPDRAQIVGKVMTFDGDKMRFDAIEVSWVVDPAKAPKQIDCTILKGPENEVGMVSQGVYKLEGDRLTLHLSHPGDIRPTGFVSRDGENSILLTLERAKK